MKKLLLIISLLLTGGAVFGQASNSRPISAALDSKGGFRDVKFGATPAEIEGLELVGEDGENKLYIRPSDEMKIGKADVTRIVYCFYREQLYAVQITVKPGVNTDELLKAFTSAFGSPYMNDRYRWRGEFVSLSLENSKTHSNMATMSNRELLKFMSEETEKKAPAKSVNGL